MTFYYRLISCDRKMKEIKVKTYFFKRKKLINVTAKDNKEFANIIALDSCIRAEYMIHVLKIKVYRPVEN